MKPVPQDIAQIFSHRMEAAHIPDEDRRNYMKWLRFYLDFCEKYKHSPTHPDSSIAFIQKLTEKRQTPAKQRQAAQSIRVYLDILNPKQSDKPPLQVEIANTATHPAHPGWAKVFDTLRDTIRLRNYSPKTYSTYAGWIGRFELFIKEKPPADITMEDVKAFLTSLAVHSKVSASTQNQAFNALLFLFRHILKRESEFDAGDGIVRAKQKKYIPVVLTRREVDLILSKLHYPYDLIANCSTVRTPSVRMPEFAHPLPESR